MSKEDEAATCIQARFRGFQWRIQQRRGTRAVTKLQALQRGRFTRREFAELRDFSREQEGFQQATRRRQIRIWQNEQELYFLQHTNAADLERVRAFQRLHAARLIQRTWRGTKQLPTPAKETTAEIIDPTDRIYHFDPFELAPAASGWSSRFDHWRHDKENAEKLQSTPSLLLGKDEIRASASTSKLPSVIADEQAFTTRRKAIQERIKRLSAQEKLKTTQAKTPVGNNGTEGQVNRRRELYEKVMAMKRSTSQRVLRYQRGIRASRPDRELFSAYLVVSCENRLNHLRVESPDRMAPTEDNLQVHDVEEWDPTRRVRAWNHHRRAVCSVLDKRHWWQTQLAGEQRDIRHVIVAKSPWEDENKIWSWPRSESSDQKEASDDTASVWPSMEIQQFLDGSKAQETRTIKPVNDDEASEWWRAHCTQSHLAINGALVIQSPYSAEFSGNITSEGDIYPVCTSEVVANRDLYELQQRAKHATRTKSLESDVEQRMKALKAQVEWRVHEMETQVEANTQLALEIVRHKKEKRERITREQQAAMTIQRYARGMQGRKYAREQRAEYFVMVRGRAIRRGRCEECGDERAVLECQQCEESVHFCPICWVHVHSTRRRKTHVAIPMTTSMDPTPVQESKDTKPRIANVNLSKTVIASVEENTGPRLRSLPAPRKQNLTRSAERSPAGLKDFNDINSSASQEDSVHYASTPLTIDTRKSSTPELAEVCALARRVRTKVREAPLTADTVLVPVGTVFPAQETSTDEIDFSTVDADCEMMDEVEVNTEQQQQTFFEPTGVVEVSLEAVQPELAGFSPEARLYEPEERSNSTDVQLDAAVSASTNELAIESEKEAESIPAVLNSSLEGHKAVSGDQSMQNPANTLSDVEIELKDDSKMPEAAELIDATGTMSLPTPTQPDKAQVISVTEEQVDTVNLTDALGVEAQDVASPSERPTTDVDTPPET